MHTNPRYIEKWVEYSCFDAEITYFLRETLAKQLCNIRIAADNMDNKMALYTKYWLPFGELLTDMERKGFAIDVDHLKIIERQALKDRQELEDKFKAWVLTV